MTDDPVQAAALRYLDAVRVAGNGDGSVTMRCTFCGDGLPPYPSRDLDDLVTRWAGHLERRHDDLVR